MNAAEFEHQWKEKKTDKKADFIHLIQVGVAHAARFHLSNFSFSLILWMNVLQKRLPVVKWTDAVLREGPRSHSYFLPESPRQEREADHHSGVG